VAPHLSPGPFALGRLIVGAASLGLVVAAVAYARGVTLQKPVLARVSALNVTWLACVVGAVATAPFGPQLAGELAAGPPDAAAWLVYLGLFPTALGFTTWAFALGRTSAGRLGAMTYLVTPIAIGLSWLILEEVPPAVAITGGALCIGGVVIARIRVRFRPALAADQA